MVESIKQTQIDGIDLHAKFKTFHKSNEWLRPCDGPPGPSDSDRNVRSQVICRAMVVHVVEADITLHLVICNSCTPL